MTHARGDEDAPAITLEQVGALVKRVEKLYGPPRTPLRWFRQHGVVTVWDRDDALVMAATEGAWDEMRRLSEAVP